MTKTSKKVFILFLLISAAALCFAESVDVTISATVTRTRVGSNYTYSTTGISINKPGYDIYYCWSNNSNSAPTDASFQQYSSGSLSSSNQYLWICVKNAYGTYSTKKRFYRNGSSSQSVTIVDPDPPGTPTITDRGIYSNNPSQHVLQITTTNGTLYYTTDGSAPSSNSIAYTSSTSSALSVQGGSTAYVGILVLEGQTVSAVSVNEVGSSSIVSYTVPLIAEPPTPTIVNHGVYASDNTKRVIEITYSGSCDGLIYSTNGSTPRYGNGSSYSPSSYRTADGNTYNGVLISEGSTINAVTYNRAVAASNTFYKYSSSATLFIRTSSSDQSGSVWYQHTTYDALNVFDLESAYYTPLRSVTWGNNSAVTGTINESNYIGQLGVRNCSHEILFTVETNGRFVSRSDPSKYKEFWIAMCPRYNYNGSDYGYFWDITTNAAVNSNDQAPNTKSTGTASIISPVTYSSGRTTIDVASNTKRYITTFWIDLAMCMDALDSDSLQHLEVNDDYYTTITLRWECYTDILYGDCTSAHSGEYVITLRGYYGVSEVEQDAVSFIVEAEGSSQSLNIRSILNAPTKIATMNILSTNKTTTNNMSNGTGTGYAWANNVFAYLSSRADYTQAATPFVLTNVSEKNRGQTIPFTIEVYNQSDHTLNQTFDGTNYWNGKTHAQTNQYCLDLSNAYNVTTDRYGNIYNALNFIGDVNILISDDGTILANENNAYSGRYEAYIYYHIIYDPN